MHFLQAIKLIQGGMGVYVSNWRLARAVAMERPGITAGTVSGTALDVVYVRMLQLGDPGGHLRKALAAFDMQFGVEIGQKILDRYFIDGGKAPSARFKNAPKQMVRALDGSDIIPLPVTPVGAAAPEPVELALEQETVELLIATGFSEVWLAKEGAFRQYLHQFPAQNRTAPDLHHVRRDARRCQWDYRRGRQSRWPARHLFQFREP